ncbi:MAG: DNA recombination protein RmuC [Planctomycetota bacterium]
MEIAIVVVGLLALGLAGVCVWLGLRLGRAGGEAAAARAEAEAARDSGREAADRLREELDRERADRDASGRRVLELSEQLAEARSKVSEVTDRLGERDAVEARFREAFAGLTAEALKSGREEFLAQARPVFEAATKAQDERLRPIDEVLKATREKLESIEKSRAEAFAALNERVDLVTQAGRGLREETNKLTRALSRPEVRGQYGEIQLRRVAELAGMTSYCDFTEQTSERNEDGELLRPDMVVQLPNERVIAVDAKTNTYAYLEAVNAEDPAEQERHMERFAKHVHEQAKKLSDKRYWSLWDGSPEFVVMFVPGDHFIDAALARKPELIAQAAEWNVILASPSTLIGLLRAVAVGWREHRLAEEAGELFALGKELHERAAVAFEHAGKLGKTLGQTVGHYNGLVGSIDSRLVPTLRKFEDVGAKSSKTLEEMKPVERQAKLLETGGASGGASGDDVS